MSVEELQALTTSIGQYCVSAVDGSTLLGLQVVLDPSDMTTDVAVALLNDSDAERKRVISEFFGIEELFFDETVLTLHFVASIDTDVLSRKSVPAFSFA